MLVIKIILYYNKCEGGEKVQYPMLLKDEKRKISNLIKRDFVKMNFSNLKLILDNDLNEPRWMDVYILLYKAKLPQDIISYDILLNKLSSPFLKFYFKKDGKRYIANADDKMIREYIRFLTEMDTTEYEIETQFIPDKEYIDKLLKFDKFKKCGIWLTHVNENEFVLKPINYKISNEEEAQAIYDKIFDAYDLFNNLKLDVSNFLENFETCLEFGKDKRMIATLSTMLSCFKCNFVIEKDYIGIKDTNLQITDEDSAKAFQAHLLDTYQFFRNVVNAENKRDIVSEIYNKKVSPEIIRQFEENMPLYLNVAQNKDFIDWIITISKESKYTLKITFDSQGVFNIDGNIITTPNEAKAFYISYMEKNKDKVASMTLYHASLVTKIKSIWSKIKSKFGKKVKK